MIKCFAYPVAAALAFVGACATQPDASVSYAPMALEAGSTAERIKTDVYWLADDARAGREAGTQGYDDAARYVADRMSSIGLEPGAGDDWFQQVPLRAARRDLDAAALTVTGADGDKTELIHLKDFWMTPSIAEKQVDFTARAVFVGFGVHAPEAGHDDYAGLDLDGKIVVRFGGAPDAFGSSEERAHYGSSANKAKTAAEHGAVGVVGLFTEALEAQAPWDRFVSNPQRSSMTWVWPDGTAEVSGRGIMGSAIPRSSASEVFFKGAKKTFAELRTEADAKGGAPMGFDLPVTITMRGALHTEDLTSPNVVGLIEGADPALKDEFVVLTAHLDHEGVDEEKVAAGKDGINNGAMDNALGIAVMLEVARRFTEDGPPARSVIFLAVTAEEKGLLGADYFAHFPTAPAENIVANVNLDMPVMLHDFADVVAFGAERSSLGPIVRKAVESAGLELSPDPFPELGIFTRSDHYRFVEKGVPSVYLFPGFANGGEEAFNGFMRDHYHKPSDEVTLPIRYDSAARFADVNYEIARAIADASERPKWNEGDFFGDLFSR